MIVFISDLHFVDETAGKHNVDARAFELFIEDLDWFIARRKKIGELKVVLLGDVFDVLRTEYWFGVKPTERPWALPLPKPAALQAHTKKVLTEVIKKSKGQLNALVEGLGRIGKNRGLNTELVYVPGNHDRLVNMFGPLRAQVRKALGLGDSTDRFAHSFEDREHGVLARHGHEFDEYNFEMATKFDDIAYDAVPIGDPITTELISRIPVVVMEEAAKWVPGLTKPEKEKLKMNFQDLGNVRPFGATVEWLLDQVRVLPALKNAIEDAIDRTVEEFEKLPFVEDWLDRHDSWTDWFDEADKMQAVFFLLKNFKCLPLGELMNKAEKLKLRLSLEDPQSKGAASLFQGLSPEFRFVVMGHTHESLQTPIHRDDSLGTPEVEQIYLNTGTWRRRQHRCLTGQGFMAWKDMTYVTIYKPGERDNEVPVFDTWSGLMS